MSQQIIHIRAAAAPKPALGQPCNGCGVCCLVEPCPLGVLLSGRRAGACDALRWHDETARYRCGAMIEAKSVLQEVLPRRLRALAAVLAPVLGRLAGRWIAAGQGCDCSLTVEIRRQSD